MEKNDRFSCGQDRPLSDIVSSTIAREKMFELRQESPIVNDLKISRKQQPAVSPSIPSNFIFFQKKVNRWQWSTSDYKCQIKRDRKRTNYLKYHQKKKTEEKK